MNVKLLSLISISFFITIVKSTASTYYVAPFGNDSHTKTKAQSTTTPWKTISKASQEVQAGDTIVVADGEYSEGPITFANSGTSSQWITLKSASGAHPIITKSGVLRALYIYQRSYIHINGFILHGYDNDGISIFYSDYIISSNIHAYDNGNAGINIVDSDHIIIQDCLLHHNGWNPSSGWGDGLSINNHRAIGKSSIVRRNIMYANFQRRTGSYSDGNGMTWDMAGTGGTHIMYNNIFFNNGGKGVLNVDTGNMAIYNNVLFRNMADYYRSSGSAEMYLIDDWVGNTLLKNNIIYARASTAKHSSLYPIVRTVDPNEDEVVENNLIWGENEGNTQIYWLRSMSLSSWISTKAPSTLTGDPGFVTAPFDNGFTSFHGSEWIDMDINDYNFELKSNSRLIDSGTFLTKTTSLGSGTNIPLETARYFTDGFGIENQGALIKVGSNSPVRITNVDYDTNRITLDRSITWNNGDGVSLPYSGSAPDIGAFEYGAGADTTPPSTPTGVMIVE